MQGYKTYIDFVRYAIGSQQSAPDASDGFDWAGFYEFCLRQGIAGLVLDGLERSGAKAPPSVLFGWIGTVETVKHTNQLVNKRCQQVSRFWEKRGYRSCILKGQANAMMYPKPELRSPGDIDIWVDGPADGMDDAERTAEIIRIAQQEAPKGHYSLHHVTMPVFSDTSVEVHYRPVFLDNWWLDRKLKRHTEQEKGKQFKNKVLLSDGKTEVCGLTDEFNAVFLLLHMWHHLLSTRNSLKQLVDYYFLLERGFTEAQRKETASKFKELGVMKYAQGIMWIEHEVLGLEERHLLVEPNEKIGRLLLRETLHYGERRRQHGSKAGTLVRRITANLHLFWHFPAPVLIAPAYLVWHQWWKWRMKRRLSKP